MSTKSGEDQSYYSVIFVVIKGVYVMSEFSYATKPIIIIGMHRSGTTMVAEMLERLGLFIGAKQDINAEAVFFLRINEWILQQCGGSWDNPSNIRLILENMKMRSVVRNHLSSMLDSPMLISYLGLFKYLRYRRLDNIRIPWGWKDPRNTYTLPLWLDIFPEGRIIHVYRHGIDVAKSLNVRVKRVVESGRIQSRFHDLVSVRLPRRSKFAFSPVCSSIEGGFKLWESYMEEAKKIISQIANPVLEIKYESFLASPTKHLDQIAEFCRLDVSMDRIKAASTNARIDRAYAFRSANDLNGFANAMSSRLAKYGY